MTKSDLIAAVATKIGASKKDSEKAVAAVIESITEALANGESVQLVGFGTFEVKARAARKGVTPEPKRKSPSKLPSSRPSKPAKLLKKPFPNNHLRDFSPAVPAGDF